MTGKIVVVVVLALAAFAAWESVLGARRLRARRDGHDEPPGADSRGPVPDDATAAEDRPGDRRRRVDGLGGRARRPTRLAAAFRAGAGRPFRRFHPARPVEVAPEAHRHARAAEVVVQAAPSGDDWLDRLEQGLHGDATAGTEPPAGLGLGRVDDGALIDLARGASPAVHPLPESAQAAGSGQPADWSDGNVKLPPKVP